MQDPMKCERGPLGFTTRFFSICLRSFLFWSAVVRLLFLRMRYGSLVRDTMLDAVGKLQDSTQPIVSPFVIMPHSTPPVIVRISGRHRT